MSIVTKFYGIREVTDEQVAACREARKAAIEVYRAYDELNRKLLALTDTSTATTMVERNDEMMRDLCETFDLLFDLPKGSYWDEEHLAALSDSEAYGEMQLHMNQLAYHDGDDPNSKSEREFAIQMIDYIATLHPDCFAR